MPTQRHQRHRQQLTNSHMNLKGTLQMTAKFGPIFFSTRWSLSSKCQHPKDKTKAKDDTRFQEVSGSPLINQCNIHWIILFYIFCVFLLFFNTIRKYWLEDLWGDRAYGVQAKRGWRENWSLQRPWNDCDRFAICSARRKTVALIQQPPSFQPLTNWKLTGSGIGRKRNSWPLLVLH